MTVEAIGRRRLLAAGVTSALLNTWSNGYTWSGGSAWSSSTAASAGYSGINVPDQQ